MAREIRTFEVAVPAGTPVDAPATTALEMPPRIVTGLHVVIPPGPAGNVGFYVAAAGQNIIPYNPGEWIITDDEVIDWPLSGYHDSGSWALVAYNTGTYTHTLYVRFLLELTTDTTTSAPAPIPAGTLTSFNPDDLAALLAAAPAEPPPTPEPAGAVP